MRSEGGFSRGYQPIIFTKIYDLCFPFLLCSFYLCPFSSSFFWHGQWPNKSWPYYMHPSVKTIKWWIKKDTSCFPIYYGLLDNRFKYLFSPHFRSVYCRWSSFWQNV